MNVLVDSSVWIDYFRSGQDSDQLDFLLEENLLVTNNVILTELIPYLTVQNQKKVIKLLRKVKNLSLDIQEDEIVDFQISCLKLGLNGIGIPDLIIAQNALQHDCPIYSLDSHFKHLKKAIGVKLLST